MTTEELTQSIHTKMAEASLSLTAAVHQSTKRKTKRLVVAALQGVVCGMATLMASNVESATYSSCYEGRCLVTKCVSTSTGFACDTRKGTRWPSKHREPVCETIIKSGGKYLLYSYEHGHRVGSRSLCSAGDAARCNRSMEGTEFNRGCEDGRKAAEARGGPLH